MTKFIEFNRKLFFLLCIFFSLYCIKFYDGSKTIFIIYNFFVIYLSYYLTCKSSSFFSFFLAFYIFMGFWFKYSFSLSLYAGNVYDSGILRASNIDDVLLISIYIFLTIIIGNFISKKIFFYKKKNYNINYNFFYNIYSSNKNLILILFIFLFLFTGLTNFYLKLYIKGMIFENNYNFWILSLMKWMILFGFTSFSCFILHKETLSKNKKIILFFLIAFFEIFISYTSMLSRAIVLVGIPFMYAIIFYENIFYDFNKKYFFVIAIFFTFTFTSVYLANKERISLINKLKEDYRKEMEIKKNNKTLNKIDNKKYLTSEKFYSKKITPKNWSAKEDNVNFAAKEDNVKHMSSFIMINRWVGIDSLINVSRSNKLSFEMFFKAFKEKKRKIGNTFYEENFNLGHTKTSFHHKKTYLRGNTLPGLFSFYIIQEIYVLF